MPTPKLEHTRCAICNTVDDATEVYAANFDFDAFNRQTFSARRLPDRVHYRIVRCNHCGLLRSDPVADAETVNSLYQQSTLDYAGEVRNLQTTYGGYLDRLNRYHSEKGCLLEIGSANGFFLEEALRHGYSCVTGIEPSTLMVEQAVPAIRPYMINDVMRPGLLQVNTFDVVCMFQVFDHLPHPATVLQEAHKILRENGLILLFNHNERALSARILGEQSPIIDIEHTYLYNLETMRRILEVNGFKILEIGSSQNLYNLQYLVRLLPLPHRLRGTVINFIGRTALGRIQLQISLGNLYAIATKAKEGVS